MDEREEVEQEPAEDHCSITNQQDLILAVYIETSKKEGRIKKKKSITTEKWQVL